MSTSPASTASLPQAEVPLPELQRLVHALRQVELPVGTGEVVDAVLLLRRLGIETLADVECNRLRSRLKPLLCKSSDPAARQAFDQVFNDWHAGLWTRTQQVGPGADNGKSQPPLQPPRPWLWVGLVGAGLSLCLVLVLFALSGREQQDPETIVVPPSLAASAAPPSTGASNPAAPLPASGPLPGYWPQLSESEALRPEIAWGSLLLPLVALLWITLPLVIGRRHAWSGHSTTLQGWGHETLARRLVFDLPATTAGQLDRHLRGPADERHRLSRRPRIDLPRTVEATLQRLGIPQLRYRHARLRPGYLVLVEADRDDALPVLWCERLGLAGVEIDLRRFEPQPDGSAPICLPVGRPGQSCRFDALPAPAWGQRLVLVSDGGFLLDAEGNWRNWALAARLERWPVRALFSPREPQDFLSGRLKTLDEGLHEGDPGFLVLPQEDAALDAWSTWLATGHLPPIRLLEGQRFPRLIQEHDEARWVAVAGRDPPVPDATTLRALLTQLQVYLGDNGFYWLCCCAVPPLLDPQLTLLLGEHFLVRSGVREEQRMRYHLARSYRLLARLPWLRHGSMPDWLRLALLTRLSPSLQQEVRRAVTEVLEKSVPGRDGHVVLAFGLPKPSGNAAGTLPAVVADALYVGFLDGLEAEQLLLRIPGPWKDWLGRLGPRLGWQQRMAAWVRAWGARLVHRHGLAHQGRARPPLVFAALLSILAICLLLAVALVPAADWPPAWRQLLLTRPALAWPQHGVAMLALSPDGSRLATADSDGTVHLWDTRSGAVVSAALEHGGPLAVLAFDPAGQSIGTATHEGVFRRWNAADGQLLQRPWQPVARDVTAVALTSDGRTGLTATKDGYVTAWNLEAQQPAGSLMPQNYMEGGVRHTVNQIVLSRNGSSALLLDGSVLLAMFKSSSPKDVSKLPQGITDPQISSDGQVLMFRESNVVHVWDTQTSQNFELPDAALYKHFVLSPDGQRLLTVSWSGSEKVSMWDVDREKETNRLTLRFRVRPDATALQSLIFSPDSRRFAMLDDDGGIVVRDAQSGAVLGEPLVLPPSPMQFAFSDDGSHLAAATPDGLVRLWSAGFGTPVGEPMNVVNLATASFSPDGQRLITVARDGTVQLWDGQSGQRVAVPQPLRTALRSVPFSPDSRRFAVTDSSGQVVLHSAVDGSSVLSRSLPAKAFEEPLHLGFDSQHSTLFELLGDGWALWNDDQMSTDPKTFMRLGRFSREPVVAGTLSPDGTTMAVIDASGTAWLYRADGEGEGRALTQVRGVRSMAFNREGTQLAAADTGGTVWRFQTATGEPLGRPLNHETPVVLVRFSADGQQLLSVREGGTLRLWNIATSQLVWQSMPHGSPVREVQWSSPQGRYIFSLGADGTARIWNAMDGRPLGTVVSGPVVALDATTGRALVAVASGGAMRLWMLPPDDASGSDAGLGTVWDTVTQAWFDIRLWLLAAVALALSSAAVTYLRLQRALKQLRLHEEDAAP